MASPIKRKRAVAPPPAIAVGVSCIADVQSVAVDSVLTELRGHLVWSAASARNVEVISLNGGRQAIAVFSFKLTDSTSPVSGQAWREQATSLGPRISRTWTSVAENPAAFPRLTFRRVRVVLAKGSTTLRTIRLDKETELTAEEPCALLLQPRSQLFMSSVTMLEVQPAGPVCIRGRLSELGELQASRGGSPLRSCSFVDKDGRSMNLVAIGENADALFESDVYIWQGTLVVEQDQGRKIFLYDESYLIAAQTHEAEIASPAVHVAEPSGSGPAVMELTGFLQVRLA